jgi:hypothetical protein
MQFGPHSGTGTQDQQPYHFSAIAQCHHEQTGFSVLAALLVANPSDRCVTK